MVFCSPGQIPRILWSQNTSPVEFIIRKYRSELTEYKLGIMDRDNIGENGDFPKSRALCYVVRWLPRWERADPAWPCAVLAMRITINYANAACQAPGWVPYRCVSQNSVRKVF